MANLYFSRLQIFKTGEVSGLDLLSLEEAVSVNLLTYLQAEKFLKTRQKILGNNGEIEDVNQMRLLLGVAMGSEEAVLETGYGSKKPLKEFEDDDIKEIYEFGVKNITSFYEWFKAASPTA